MTTHIDMNSDFIRDRAASSGNSNPLSQTAEEAEYRECFDLFSKQNGADQATVNTKEIGTALVQLGLLDAEELQPGTEGYENWDMDVTYEVSMSARVTSVDHRPASDVRILFPFNKCTLHNSLSSDVRSGVCGV